MFKSARKELAKYLYENLSKLKHSKNFEYLDQEAFEFILNIYFKDKHAEVWDIDDVKRLADYHLTDCHLTDEQAKYILKSAFRDNEEDLAKDLIQNEIDYYFEVHGESEANHEKDNGI